MKQTLLLSVVAAAFAVSANAAPQKAVPFKQAAAKPAPAVAAKPAAAETQQAAAARVEQYLSAISTMTASFSQVSADGSLGAGKFFLKRPGKMRWEYTSPAPVLLVSDGDTVVYYDKEVDQISYLDAKDTMASFLTQPRIQLESPITHVTQFESKEGMIRATLVQKAKPRDGSLTLEFSDRPLQLRQMIVTDATGQITHVQLQNVRYGVEIMDSLFSFTDPRSITHRRARAN